MGETIRNIGFIGTGIMGAPMAGHLLDAGYGLHVFNRSRSKAEGLCGRGAVWHNDPASLARACDTVITIVGAPPDVEQITFGTLLDHVRPGGLLIDMTTSSPSLAARIHSAAAEKGIETLDAPVSGGEEGAKNGTLTIMAGGDPPAFARALPLLEKMGKKIFHCGGAGSGQRLKLTNQILVASNILAVVEALAFADRGRLDRGVVMRVLAESTGNSRIFSIYGEKILAGDYSAGFFIDHFLKDMGIALAEADTLGLDLKSLRNAIVLFEELKARFSGTEGIQAIARLYF
jgi:3-hydroxyisobutyrate dehydrogenase